MQNKLNGNIEFLRKKIVEIKTALFRSESDADLKLPDNIIRTLRVEDDGTVWFFTTCNGNYARFINKPFYATLAYYKKDTGCSIQLGGNATVVENDYKSPFHNRRNDEDAYKIVLVKMKIIQAGVFENKSFGNISWAERMRTVINNLFIAGPQRVYNFS